MIRCNYYDLMSISNAQNSMLSQAFRHSLLRSLHVIISHLSLAISNKKNITNKHVQVQEMQIHEYEINEEKIHSWPVHVVTSALL